MMIHDNDGHVDDQKGIGKKWKKGEFAL